MANNISLNDKYELDSGQIYLTGIQALVRLAIMLKKFDEKNGLNTAGFISGYRGSPLAAYDLMLWKAKKYLEANKIQFTPGINEDLAATSVWGSQQTNLFEGQKYQGVFGLWYGKGPGVDRCGDVFKHANYAGTSPHGGVLVLAGDDHIAESSTLPHQSEHALMAADIPVINPADIQDLLNYGIYGIALSRFSGCWIGMKTISENVNASSTVFANELDQKIILPTDFEMPLTGLHIKWPDTPMEQEERMGYKHAAAQAFVRANQLDQIIWQSSQKRIGIVTTGKAYLDTLHALKELGIDEKRANEIGLSIYKVFMTWPLETERIKQFAQGHDELIIIEEKRPVIEDQIKIALFAEQKNIRIVGKKDLDQSILLPWQGELTPRIIAKALVKRLKEHSIDLHLRPLPEESQNYTPPKIRTPYYCSGCPHNSSTIVPEGSQALGGIGCHIMAAWLMPERNTVTVTHMGGEGANWIGISKYLENDHIFANLGDGTYFHSGLLAIRAAVSAKINITFKILYNDAVAMTGGQPVEGQLLPQDIAHQLAAENISKIAVISDDIKKYNRSDFPHSVTFHPREDLEFVQKSIRAEKGTSAIIYDQTCAAEKRRRRKRGLMDDPPKRVFINELVCEGCGDCSAKSNCVSVMPKETEFGRKRMIDQSSCNKDYSCVNGFCPSFVTVHGGQLKQSQTNQQVELSELEDPKLPNEDKPWRIIITGIGGTGVVTISALLGTAAHIEGKASTNLDMAGLAQKGGLVISHVQIGAQNKDLNSVRIDEADADLLFACDPMNAAHPEMIRRVEPGRTHAVINTHQTITGEFTKNPDYDFRDQEIEDQLKSYIGEEFCSFLDSTHHAVKLFNNSIMANLLQLGYAYQKGFVPLKASSIEEAIHLNKVMIDQNIAAFRWGRKLAMQDVSETISSDKQDDLAEMIAHRYEFLTNYQNKAYAEKYKSFVERIWALEKQKCADADFTFSKAVIKYAFKLMAYKDEYEVARLYTNGAFLKKLEETFEGDYKLHFHLAPPLLAKKDKATGHLRKSEYGPWMMRSFKLLAKMKFLRGTMFDIFGYTEERRHERKLIPIYFNLIEEQIEKLSKETYQDAVEKAEIPEHIRGFGHVKNMDALLDLETNN